MRRLGIRRRQQARQLLPPPDVRLVALAFVLLLLALWLPPIALPRATHDAVVVFDITQSMDAEDQRLGQAPASRLAFARDAARQALGELPCGSRVGWGAFAEYRTLLLVAPLEVCEHYGDLLASLALIDGRMRWANASQVSKGVFWAVRAAKELQPHPAVVFVSDGHEAPPLASSEIAPFDDVKPGEIAGWLLGTGELAPQPIPRTDDAGQRIGYWRADEVVQPERSEGGGAPREHLSGLREQHLMALARQTGFGYARLDGPAAMKAAMTDPRALQRRPVPTRLNALPALAALLLLVLRFRPDPAGFRLRRMAPAASTRRARPA